MNARVHALRLLIVPALVLPACARRLDERTRRAWTSSGAQADEAAPGSRPPSSDPGEAPGEEVPAIGWDRVTQLLDGAVALMQRSPDQEALARLAQSWCAETPRRATTEDGEVWACEPTPPVVADGARFTLELGAPGVIGLVAADLSAADGERIAAGARRTAARWCTAPFTAVSNHAEDPASREPKVETCPIEGGPLLAIARLPLDRTGQTWQVSVTIVGAS